MTNTEYRVPAIPFGSLLDGREHLGMVLSVTAAASRWAGGYWVPQTDVLFSNGFLRLPSDAIVALSPLPAAPAPF